MSRLIEDEQGFIALQILAMKANTQIKVLSHLTDLTCSVHQISSVRLKMPSSGHALPPNLRLLCQVVQVTIKL